MGAVMIRFVFLAVLSVLLALPLRAAPLSPEQQAVHVLNRLAYGPRPGDIEHVVRVGVRQYIDSQLEPASIPYPQALSARLAALDTVNRPAGEALAEFLELRCALRSGDEAARQRGKAGFERLAHEAAAARLLRAIESPRQLEEVLVEFWFNHFNVFAGKGITGALVAHYERDAIRPHVLGRFRDLLGATTKHPAMLLYLENHRSRAGALNENHARALMELHTIGPDAGHTARDVRELARMLSGWTFDPDRLVRHNDGFRFEPRRHDQGSKRWLGHTVAPAGEREGELALDVLANHPATARRLSYKLAQYFVSDAPPAALVERIARTWGESGGDIRAVVRTVFASDEFMAPQALGAKFKSPYRFVVSAVRAGGAHVSDTAPLELALGQLGMPLYGCPAASGYPNTGDAWFSRDALARRVAFATALASGRVALWAEPLSQADSASAAIPARATTQAAPHMGTIAPAIPPPLVTDTVSSAAMAAATNAAPFEAGRLQSTLGSAISPATIERMRRASAGERSAVLLGSADFMRY